MMVKVDQAVKLSIVHVFGLLTYYDERSVQRNVVRCCPEKVFLTKEFRKSLFDLEDLEFRNLFALTNNRRYVVRSRCMNSSFR